MRFYYRTSEESDGWLASSEPVEAYGRGRTELEAVDDLRRVLSRELVPEAVAPPANATEITFELLPLAGETAARRDSSPTENGT